MTAEVMDDRSDRGRHADRGGQASAGQEGGETICPQQGAAAFEPELSFMLKERCRPVATVDHDHYSHLVVTPE